jgi:hypothetical protein
MVTEWVTVGLTMRTSAPRTGFLLLPQTSDRIHGPVMIKSASLSPRILRCGVRADPGEAAWADAEVVVGAGGEGKTIDYAPAKFLDVLRFSAASRLQAAIGVFTFVAAVLTAYLTFIKNSSASDRFTSGIALVALVIALVLAVLKFRSDWRSATG